MPGFRSPNYTQTPNELFDLLLPGMGEAELRVVLAICRQTFGFHRETCKLSIGQLMKLTGMSETGVLNGAQAGIERGILGKEVDGTRKTTWFLIVEDEEDGVKTTPPGEVVLKSSEKLPLQERYSTPPGEVVQAYLKKDINKGRDIKDSVSLPISGSKLTPAEIWDRVKELLRLDLTRAWYEKYVEGAYIVDYEDGKFTVAVRDPEWMTSRLASQVSRLLSGYTKDLAKVEFVAMELENANSV